MRRYRCGLWAMAAGVAGVALTLGGCGLLGGDGSGSGHEDGGAADRQSGAAGRGGAMPADSAAAKIMGTDVDGTKAVATAKGTLDVTGSKSSVVAEVLSVHAYPETTQVTWRLKSANGTSVETKSFQLAKTPLFDTRQLGLVDPATSTTYKPFTYVPMSGVAGNEGRDNNCVCGDLPSDTDGTGTVLYAEFPALPKSVSSAAVTLPGFATMSDVPVTR